MAKLPSIQFYPGDWKKDPGIQVLTLEEKGAWFEMLLAMFESEKRGVLLLNGNPYSDNDLALLLGVSIEKCSKIVKRLLEVGVASEDKNTFALCCRRMLRDETLRQIRAKAGKQGGRPCKSKTKAKRKQNITPSSSSSSSSSDNTPLTPLGEKRKIIYDSWNFHMSKLPGYGTIKPGKTSDKLIDACLKGCHDFPERYKTQAHKFRQVDDSGWTTGKVSFHWTLRQATIDKLEAGGYRMKGENTTPAQSYGRHPDDCSYRPKEDSHDN